jgi:CheY-like chemotaxis protein
LVVDDDAKSLMAMRELLQTPRQRVVTAQSGDAAIECVRNDEFAVILLDARMPIMDGFETARMIREHPRRQRRFFPDRRLRGPPSMFRGYEAGAVNYITQTRWCRSAQRSRCSSSSTTRTRCWSRRWRAQALADILRASNLRPRGRGW